MFLRSFPPPRLGSYSNLALWGKTYRLQPIRSFPFLKLVLWTQLLNGKVGRCLEAGEKSRSRSRVRPVCSSKISVEGDRTKSISTLGVKVERASGGVEGRLDVGLPLLCLPQRLS